MSNVNYRKIYEELREAGLVKMFESISIRFFMGIASTLTHPISGEQLFLDLDSPDKTTPISDKYKEVLHEVIRPEDSLRYHVIISDIFVVHYVILLNDGLKGRVKESPNSDEAITRMRIVTEEATGSDETRKKIEAVMVIGNGSENVNDTTRGPLIKHELCHIVLKYLLEIGRPDVLEFLENGETEPDAIPTKEDMAEFTEFLCDFIQFDSTIINKYTVNPITKFSDALEFIFKPGTGDKYSRFLRSIAPFFDEQM